MRPIKTIPVFKDYLWGGQRLRTEYGKKSDLPVIAESWELSCNPAGISGVEGQRENLQEFLSRQDASFLGTDYDFNRAFPLLVKLIDAKDRLSIQVHPDDDYALIHENSYGKTEMWVVLDSVPGATLYYGMNRNCTKEELGLALRDGTITELLNCVPVQPGDVFFITPGTIHAIGAGILLAEIQQNSDLTYRLYDYGRRDAQGNLRRLDLEKGLAVSDCKAREFTVSPTEVGCSTRLAGCRYFTTFRLSCREQVFLKTAPRWFEILLMTEGSGILKGPFEDLPLQRGECVMVPAGLGAYRMEGSCRFLRVVPAEIPSLPCEETEPM